MRILVVGAGALGGYFGGRLKEAGRDVTFLVRPRRVEQLAKTGLLVRSPKGDIAIAAPPTVLSENIRAPFDLILLSCKAYDLPSAMDSFAPAVGPNTAILPLLNGMKHMDLLGARFGAGAVLGGQCIISATLDAEGRVVHLNDLHFLSFGEQSGAQTARTIIGFCKSPMPTCEPTRHDASARRHPPPRARLELAVAQHYFPKGT